MDGLGTVIAASVPIVALIGGGFGYLIRMIVTSSKEAVEAVTQDRDVWMKRALDSGWKGDT